MSTNMSLARSYRRHLMLWRRSLTQRTRTLRPVPHAQSVPEPGDFSTVAFSVSIAGYLAIYNPNGSLWIPTYFMESRLSGQDGQMLRSIR
jgi:hypothetical protein